MSPRALALALEAVEDALTGAVSLSRRDTAAGWDDSAQRIDREQVAPLTEARNWLLGMQMVQQYGAAAFVPPVPGQGVLSL